MNRIRLFVDAHWFDDLYQSTTVFIKGLYGELIKDDRFDIYMAAYNPEAVKGQFNNSNKITYLKFKSKSKYFRLIFDIPFLIWKNKIDIAHYQYISPLFKASKEIVTIHDLLYRDFKNYFPASFRMRNDIFFKRSARRAEIITSVSTYSIRAIEKHFMISDEKIKLVPNGINEDFFYPPTDCQDIAKFGIDNYILCVSRIEPRKNHLLLVRAFCDLELWKQGTSLVLVGRHDIKVKELEDYLSNIASEASAKIIRLTNVSFPDLKCLYKKASVVVYPSFAEGFGIPPLEAAALGAKVLCSNSTAMADFDFFNESLFDPNNLDELKFKLVRAFTYSNQQERKLISKTIRERYNWHSIAKTLASEIVSLNNEY